MVSVEAPALEALFLKEGQSAAWAEVTVRNSVSNRVTGKVRWCLVRFEELIVFYPYFGK